MPGGVQLTLACRSGHRHCLLRLRRHPPRADGCALPAPCLPLRPGQGAGASVPCCADAQAAASAVGFGTAFASAAAQVCNGGSCLHLPAAGCWRDAGSCRKAAVQVTGVQQCLSGSTQQATASASATATAVGGSTSLATAAATASAGGGRPSLVACLRCVLCQQVVRAGAMQRMPAACLSMPALCL